ncbi:MAG TPA: biotin-independent malonate decarboxylase subunit beta [Chthoniobacterales bacterium]|jgi:malonate decarboxylase beta subunit|nr:biotin-independent malonate decarboxylase subunit beta [Chthoniobacterales bacterium]
MSSFTFSPEYLRRRSFIELNARERAKSLFDSGTGRELAGPFDRIESPWLAIQGVTPQADDGCIVMRGMISGNQAVVIAFNGAFQGGGIGEVSGAKLTAALDLACRDNENGQPTSAVLLLETGGVRLQEANLGLAAVAEIISSIIALRRYAPVISVIAGPVGCFGGMSLAAGVSSYIVMTREGRLGLNGPEVIEEESGVEEFDASDRALIWSIYGGQQRYDQGLIDVLVDDDADQLNKMVQGLIAKGVPPIHRSEQVDLYRSRIAALDTSTQWGPDLVHSSASRHD